MFLLPNNPLLGKHSYSHCKDFLDQLLPFLPDQITMCFTHCKTFLSDKIIELSGSGVKETYSRRFFNTVKVDIILLDDFAEFARRVQLWAKCRQNHKHYEYTFQFILLNWQGHQLKLLNRFLFSSLPSP